jgi:hypothetical protein
MTIEEQLEVLKDSYRRADREVFPASIYQSCKILIQNGLAEIYGMNENEVPMIRATELGHAFHESYKQEELQ